MSSQDFSDIPPEQSGEQNISQLLSSIERAVMASEFQKAEQLREKLLEVAPMAISEAIRAAELIEEGMAAAIDKEHVKRWPSLYESLSQEEKNCLFHSMKSYQLSENRALLQYGALNNRLFFIEKGEVVVAIPQEDSKKLKPLARLGKGDVLGEYSFATLALCSATAVTKTPVQVRCLEGAVAESWSEKYPGLYDKVLEFCRNYGQIDQITKRKEQQEHPNPRYPVAGQVKAALLGETGQKDGVTFNGEVGEISRSGCSFSVHCGQKKTIKNLLTKSFSLDFSCKNKGKDVVFSAVGRVVCISVLLHDDYLFHIGFQSLLPQELDSRLGQK